MMKCKDEIRLLLILCVCDKSVSFPESPTQGKLCDNGIFIARKRGNPVLVRMPQSKTEVNCHFSRMPSIIYRKVTTFAKCILALMCGFARTLTKIRNRCILSLLNKTGKFPRAKY